MTGIYFDNHGGIRISDILRNGVISNLFLVISTWRHIKIMFTISRHAKLRRYVKVVRECMSVYVCECVRVSVHVCGCINYV